MNFCGGQQECIYCTCVMDMRELKERRGEGIQTPIGQDNRLNQLPAENSGLVLPLLAVEGRHAGSGKNECPQLYHNEDSAGVFHPRQIMINFIWFIFYNFIVYTPSMGGN